MEEFIPTFNEEKNQLILLDEFEDKIKLLNELTKEYDKLKKEIKQQMLEAGKEINAEQLKWTTPKGIKITLSIGQEAVFEKKTIKSFSLEKLMKEYPEIYENCCYEQEIDDCVKNATNDRLVITLPKEGK